MSDPEALAALVGATRRELAAVMAQRAEAEADFAAQREACVAGVPSVSLSHWLMFVLPANRVSRLLEETREDSAKLKDLGAKLDVATHTVQSLVVPPCRPFLCEKLPNLSVYSLHLPLPCPGCRTVPWTPAITVKHKHDVEVVCKVSDEAFGGCSVCGVTSPSLSLTLATDVEAERFTASVDPECIQVRMPFFYPGSVSSAHAGTFVGGDEAPALRDPSASLSCRCVASLSLHCAVAGCGSGGQGADVMAGAVCVFWMCVGVHFAAVCCAVTALRHWCPRVP